MRSWARVGVIAALALSLAAGCDDEELDPELDAGEEPSWPRADAGGNSRPDTEDNAGPSAPVETGRDAGETDAATTSDAGAAETPRPDASQSPEASTQDASSDAAQSPPSAPAETPRTEVPDALVGAWDDGALDFMMWENYREGYWAGRNAAPTREAMVFQKNGDAKFYRYEFGLNQYEELIDCEGTVAFGDDGTFTFYPLKGRKRFINSSYSANSVDRPLNATELTWPKLAGKRGYSYDPAEPSKLRITVPSSAPYNWYRKP